MKKLVLLIGIVSSLFISCTVNKPAEPERNITVSGTGSVSVKPDLVSLNFLVRTMDWNVVKAVDKNAENTARVLAAVKECGVDQNDIATYDYRVTQDNSNNYPGQYTVVNTICVEIRNPEITGKVIDAAIKQNNGANGLTSFEYRVTDKTTALRQARTLAIQNAQDAANLLAGASGCKVGTVMDIREDYTTSSPRNKIMLADSLGSGPTTPIELGTITISSNVTIRYTLE